MNMKKLDRMELAFGEVTGHAHCVSGGEVLEDEEKNIFWHTEKTSQVTHEEHKPVTVEKGEWQVQFMRQYDEKNGWRRVQD